VLKFKVKNKNKEKMNNEKETSKQNLSRIGQSLSLKGELSGNEDLVVNGRLHGEIDLGNHNLTVEREGKIEANIRAKNITIHGEIKGNIFASGKVLITKDAQMVGDISASRISIMDGAQFKGSVKMEKPSGSVTLNKT